MQGQDKLVIGGHAFDSRFILGSGKYSMKLIEAAVRDAGAQIITLAVRRANTKEQENILDYIPEGVTLLPNTSGARNAQEAVSIARLARERRARLCVITDSVLSPLAELAEAVLLVETQRISFFQSMNATNALAEYLLSVLVHGNEEVYHQKAEERDALTEDMRL